MNASPKLKEATSTLAGSFLLALQAVMGVPFLLTIVGGVRHLGSWFHPKGPR